ncbi:hypothetical protein ACFFKH_26855 [Micromonospora marina]|uniref:Uncharacterized protein n=1 Tax=Micromonospora marina TaxID=307120 RepID=A0A1C5ANH3_9ACTN|nr:hypothetical protein [Micromonospora marina]SCF46792.1 hypothetical protein GA0070215_1572 [Micromonospora marina]
MPASTGSGESGMIEHAIHEIGDLSKKLRINLDVGTQSGGTVIGAQLVLGFIQRDHSTEPITPNQLQSVGSIFARSASYYEILWDFLAPGSIVVVTGEPGVGKSIAALALLSDISWIVPGRQRFRRLGYGAERLIDVDRLMDSSDVCTILELPPDDDRRSGEQPSAAGFMVSSSFGKHLNSMAAVMSKSGGRLVVVVDESQWERIGVDSPFKAHHVVQAPGVAIMRGWLTQYGNRDVDRWLGDDEIVRLVRDESPRGVMSVMQLIMRADRVPVEQLPDVSQDRQLPALEIGDEIFQRRVLSVVAARRSWHKELLAWHSHSGRSSFERNFMLIAAAYGGAPVGDVYDAAQRLGKHFGEPSAEFSTNGQEGVGVLQVVDRVGADLAEDVVSFSRPGWEDAVVKYFWADRPRCRDEFLTWLVNDVVRPANGETESKESRAKRVVKFSLAFMVRFDKLDLLDTIVKSWHGDETLYEESIRLVARACFDQSIDRKVHHKLRLWASGGDARLIEASVRVCAGAFGIAYPGKALVRLRHAARSSDPSVLRAVKKAVAALWNEKATQPTLLKQVEAWCSDNDSAGPHIFGALAAIVDEVHHKPSALVAARDGSSTANLMAILRCWQTLLAARVDENELDESIWGWFEACLASPDERSFVLQLFRDVVNGSTAPTSLRHRLDDSLQRWSLALDVSPERRNLRRELDELLYADRYTAGQRDASMYATLHGRSGDLSTDDAGSHSTAAPATSWFEEDSYGYDAPPSGQPDVSTVGRQPPTAGPDLSPGGIARTDVDAAVPPMAVELTPTSYMSSLGGKDDSGAAEIPDSTRTS